MKKKKEKEKSTKEYNDDGDGGGAREGGRKVTSKRTADVKLWVFFGTKYKYLGYILFQTVQNVGTVSAAALCRTVQSQLSSVYIIILQRQTRTQL